MSDALQPPRQHAPVVTRPRPPWPDRRPWVVLSALAAAGALLLSGCTDDGQDESAPPTVEDGDRNADGSDHDHPAPEPDEETTEPSAEAEAEPEPDPGEDEAPEAGQDEESAAEEPGELPLWNTVWHVDSVTVEDDTVENDGSVEAELVFDGNGGLGLKACNGVSGTAEGGDGSLSLHRGTGTLMACPGLQGEIEGAILDFLSGTAEYRIDGAELTLDKESGDTMILTAEQ